ncbi:MAG: PAS domain S-box protein [Candidatus Omnitrophota bacterium]
MAEMITISKAEYANLEERVKKLAADKSHLQLIVHMMNKISAVSGLENLVENILNAVGDVIGGVNLILYYKIDNDIYYADINGDRQKIDTIIDDLVIKAFETREPIEYEHAFSDTKMMTPEFTKAYTWAIPLLVGTELIGVFKMESLHIAMRELGQPLPIFFCYAALVLKNEILGRTRLQKAYDELEKEAAVRQKAEEALRLANEALEERVAERTEEWRNANVRLRESEMQIKALLEKSEQSRRALLSLLEDEKRAEETLRRLNRELRAISQCNQVLMRAVDEQTLLDEVCRIICDEAGYRMAWVGYAEQDEAKTIRPAAWAGVGSEYISSAKLSWSEDSERGRGPAGIAIRSGKIIYVQDIETDALMAPRRENALQCGYRSSLALPLKDECANVFGVLLIYSAEVNAITPDEIRFMGELADDLTFGIAALRTRAGRKQAEKELQRSNDLLRAIIDAAPTAIIGLDLDGNVHSVWNPAAERMLGWSAQEVMGRPLPSVPIEKKEEFAQFRKRMREGKTLNGVEVKRRKRDGSPIDYSIYASPLHDAEGRITGNVAVMVDITERKRADEALRRSEKRKTILNEIANVFLTIPDEEMYGCVLDVVLRVMKSPFGIFGFIGENGDLIMPSLTRNIWEQCQVPDKSLVFPPETWGGSLWGRAIREKTSFYSDGPFHTPEGHIRIDHFLTSPIFFGQKTIGLLSLANKETSYTEEDKDLLETIAAFISPILNARLQRDAQERKRLEAEEALRKSEEQYRLLVENAEEAIFIVQDGKIEFPNRKTQELSGRSKQELTNMVFANLLLPDDQSFVLDKIEKCLHGEKPSIAPPFKIQNRSGEDVWVQLSLAMILWRERPAALCFLKDVTEQKAFEAQFMHAQRMEAIGRLAGGVAHDFNNILTVINGYSELAMFQLRQDDPLWNHIQGIHEAGLRASELTYQLLAFSRKQAFKYEMIDLNYLIENMKKMLIRLIGEDIELATVLSDSLWRIKADPVQIEQIVMNLAVNARDAMPEGGKLTIETTNIILDKEYASKHIEISPGPFVMLAVSDNGCGMNQATMDKIFDPFFTTKEMGKGTGLGLSTVYGVVKQSGGSIWVYSELNVGTTFKIYFPRSEETPLEKESSQLSSLQGAGETVLVVEDEDSVREIVIQILEYSGYKTISARSGLEALNLSLQFQGRIHLLVTDIIMPEMNGRELSERLTYLRPDMKVLYMSGYTDKSVTNNGILKGRFPFLQKPFSSESLLQKIQEALEQ